MQAKGTNPNGHSDLHTHQSAACLYIFTRAKGEMLARGAPHRKLFEAGVVRRRKRERCAVGQSRKQSSRQRSALRWICAAARLAICQADVRIHIAAGKVLMEWYLCTP